MGDWRTKGSDANGGKFPLQYAFSRYVQKRTERCQHLNRRGTLRLVHSCTLAVQANSEQVNSLLYIYADATLD
jgi:hypothetical protein